ncbi:MAG: FAD-dependent oxidoreductase [Bacilli bacterium]|nr:FAD-dependent oxidoreductase [Bacilli bacterium]
MKNYSIWKEGVTLPEFKKLDKDIVVDVLIIGGGMTGINTLYQLRNSSLEVVLVEQNRVGMGVTVNSTGKLTYLQDSLYEKIKKSYDEEVAGKYLASQREAVELAVDIINKNKIDCNLLKAPSYVYANEEGEEAKLRELKNFLEDNNVRVINGNSDLIEYKDMIGVEDTYLFQPLKYINGLISNIDKTSIYEDTSIVKMEKNDDGYICYTKDEFEIRAKWVVIASHYPYFNLPFLFPIKGSLEKSYLSASKYKEDNISLIKYDKPIISIRSYLDYILYLSNSHDNNSEVDDKKHYSELKKKLKTLGLDPEYMWSNIDIITNDGLPYVGKIDERLLIGTGYNTWGMANGILAGKILADIILDNDNKYLELFNPKRNNLGNLGGAILDGVKSISGYISGIVTDSEKVKYETLDGKEIAIYEDEEGEHKVYTKCPHMGCRLIFNETELTWDCPCHASRFDIDGKCISGPSNEDIIVEENT